jgi:hypothetical protein
MYRTKKKKKLLPRLVDDTIKIETNVGKVCETVITNSVLFLKRDIDSKIAKTDV